MKTIGRREFIYSAGHLLAAATLAGCQGGTNNAPQSNDSAQQAEREEQEEQNPTDFVDVEVKSGLSAYSWEELSEISQFIAEVKNGDTVYDFTANDVAVAFNLCSANGSLDAAETKTIVLDPNGEAQEASVRIIGFGHDDRADGSGKAGITFLFTTNLGRVRSPMPTSDDMYCTVAGEQWADNDGIPGSVVCLNANASEYLVPAFCI